MGLTTVVVTRDAALVSRRELEIALAMLALADDAAYQLLVAEAWRFVVANSACSDFPSDRA